MRTEDFIKCFVRLKPILLGEAVALAAGRRDVTVSKTKEVFSFSEVFSDSTPNSYIYRTAVEPILGDLLDGYSACVLAYGQTSSGKTFTMKGISENLGLIPLSIKEIFGRIGALQLFAKVSISYFQIYNENIIDLLSVDDQPRYLELREDGRKNLTIVDLIEQEVRDEFDALSHYERGEMRRKFASNNINFASSRSHTIFRVTLSRVVEGGKLVEGSVYMVDLAGSESISKTNAVGVLKKEAENINKSLLALTTAIRAISERQAYVNYRNSKLTRILQPSLSGSSKTVVICTVKQTDDCLAETVNTLKFGLSASAIRTDPKQRVVEGERAMSEVLEEERAERAKLEAEVTARGEAVEAARLENARLLGELEDCKHRLFALENENRHHAGLIDHYRSEQDREKSTRNIFYQRTEESIAAVEQENRNLKASIHALNETVDKRNKMVAALEKNERALLDKVEKYERELEKLDKMFSETRNEQRAKAAAINNPAADQPALEARKGSGQVDFHQLARRKPGDSSQVSSAFTIGKVVDLSTTILALKIDMNHYLSTITDLHSEISELQNELERARRAEETGGMEKSGAGGMERSGAGRRESVGSKAREDDRRLKQENQKLKQKCNHYMKILKKTANNNIDTIVGFNDYLEKNFKGNKEKLFEELFQEDTADYLPYGSYLSKPPKNHNASPKQPHPHSDSETNNPPS